MLPGSCLLCGPNIGPTNQGSLRLCIKAPLCAQLGGRSSDRLKLCYTAFTRDGLFHKHEAVIVTFLEFLAAYQIKAHIWSHSSSWSNTSAHNQPDEKAYKTLPFGTQCNQSGSTTWKESTMHFLSTYSKFHPWPWKDSSSQSDSGSFSLQTFGSSFVSLPWTSAQSDCAGLRACSPLQLYYSRVDNSWIQTLQQQKCILVDGNLIV